MKNKTILSILSVIAAAAVAQPVFASAIWTTISDGSEVNFNIYAAKEDVYLNGGPGKGAPANDPGLPGGTYVFMVTDPSGKNLLSTDAAICRQVTVLNGTGTLAGVVPAGGCQHATGTNPLGGGVPVQLFPYLDTPNNGGEYKVWLTLVGNYTCDLTAVDCSNGTHGFVPSFSKTDNFKVGVTTPTEIDTRFYNGNGDIMDGLGIVWTDTLGAINNKYSYLDALHYVNHEAHVEAPEVGTHHIYIANQPGCTVQTVSVDGVQTQKNGPQTVSVHVTNGLKNQAYGTIFVDVHCQ